MFKQIMEITFQRRHEMVQNSSCVNSSSCLILVTVGNNWKKNVFNWTCQGSID